jgi:hypothetical protein
LPNSRLSPPPACLGDWRGGIPGSSERRTRAPHPEGAWGGRTSPPPFPSPSWRPVVWPGSDWAGLGSSPSSSPLPLLSPPPFQMYNVNARKRSRKKGAENFLMRKGITSGGRREPVYCMWGLSHFFRKKTLGSKKAGDSSGGWPTGIPLCLPGPSGAWVPASWIWDSAVEVQSACNQPDRRPTLAPRVPVSLVPLPLQTARIENPGVWVAHQHDSNSAPVLQLSWL